MIANFIYNLTYPYRRYKWVRNQPNIFSLTPNKVRKANRLGFTSSEYVIYNLEEKDHHDYLREFERYEFRRRIASGYRILLDNKIVFNTLVKNYVKTNEIICYKKNRTFVVLVPSINTEDDIVKYLSKGGKFVYKRIADGGGHGINFFEFKDGYCMVNGSNCNANDIITKLKESDNYLIEEYCKQSEFENMLFPHSVNTIRIVTVEKGQGEYDISYALQRIGADLKSMVDNASGGGIFSKIDIETGCLSPAYCSYAPDLLKNDNQNIKFERHPVTGAQIAGLVIPDWENVKNVAINLHRKLSFTGIPLIAWDFALAKDGIRVIEANTTCGLGLIQREHGQRNLIMGKLFKRYKIIQ